MMTARLGILLSGSGTTYRNLAEAIVAGSLLAEIGVVISSRPDAGGIDHARRLDHPHAVAASGDEVTATLRAHGCGWVAMCGYLRFWDPPAEFVGRTLNIHPSLLPAFGGRGMYGSKVHRAVLAAGSRYSGCTVHLVGGDYDSGPILAQQVVEVRADDNVETLQQRVQAAERELYPRAVAAVLSGRMRQIDARRWLDLD